MLKVEVICTVTYTCWLTENDENIVREYAEQNEVTLDEAIKELWDTGEIDVYAGEQTESECTTESVGYSEFN